MLRYSLICIVICSSFKKRARSNEACRKQMVMGYYRNTTNFNIGKRQEYKDRIWFKEPRKETLNEQKRNA